MGLSEAGQAAPPHAGGHPPATAAASAAATTAPPAPPPPHPAGPGSVSSGLRGESRPERHLRRSAPLDDQHALEACVAPTSWVMHSRVACRHTWRARPAARAGARGRAHGTAHPGSPAAPRAAAAPVRGAPAGLRRPTPVLLPRPGASAGRRAVVSSTLAQVGLRDAPRHRRGRRGCRAIAQIVEEGAIPELDGRIDPGGLLAQCARCCAVEGRAIDQDTPGRRPVPAQEEPDEARLAGARGAHNRDMGPSRDGQSRSVRMVWPAARTLTPSRTMATPCGVWLGRRMRAPRGLRVADSTDRLRGPPGVRGGAG